MTILYILLALLGALYLAGCWLAYHALKGDTSGEDEYSRWDLFKYTLGSWLTVAIAAIGRVQ